MKGQVEAGTEGYRGMSMGKGMRSYEADHDLDEHGLLYLRPLLVIDKQGRINWAVTGSNDATRGRHCWEVLGCGATSRRQCKAVQCLDSPAATRGRSKSFAAPAYPADACLISSIPLPFQGQLVWGPRRRSTVDASAMLQVVTNLAGTILSRDLMNGGKTVLELIRITANADSGELYLADLHGKELLLAACVGSDRSSLMQRVRVESGQGFPGLAFDQTRRLVASASDSDPHFLRGEMTQSGVRSFISVPIPAPDGRILGCLNLAWRHDDAAAEALSDALLLAAVPLGNALCAAYWSLRERVDRACTDGPGSQPLASMLQVLHDTAGADAGSLVMWNDRDRKVQRTSFFGATPPSCPWLASPEAAPCASRDNESCFRLIALAKPEDRWPEPCRQIRFDGAAVCCIPVKGQDARSGRVLLGFRRRSPDSPMRLLVPLQVMVEEIGRNLHEPSAARTAAAHEHTLPQLQIRCFGHFELALGGRTLPASAFPRRDALTLLKMLVLRAGKQVHRERLVEWLWPDANEAAGVNRLHGVVHSLRGVIEPNAAQRRWIYLLNEGDAYTFRPGDSTFVDLVSFQEYLALARQDMRDGGFAPRITNYLEQAVELYRGDLFEDDRYGQWCDVERVALQREFVDALDKLARIYLTLGDTTRAIHTLRRALSLDPSREDLHQELIRCLVGLSRHQEAKEQVRDCVRNLREDLGVEPSSETQRLYHSLVTGARDP